MRHDTRPNQYDPSLAPTLLDRNGITFSKTEAARMVGGESRLKALMIEGKVRVDGAPTAANSRWRCRGGDVLRYSVFD